MTTRETAEEIVRDTLPRGTYQALVGRIADALDNERKQEALLWSPRKTYVGRNKSAKAPKKRAEAERPTFD